MSSDKPAPPHPMKDKIVSAMVPPRDDEWEKKSNWWLGLVYYAPGDPRAWVPKRSSFGRRRFGTTPNMANPEAQRYLKRLLGFFALLFLAVYLLQWLGVIE